MGITHLRVVEQALAHQSPSLLTRVLRMFRNAAAAHENQRMVKELARWDDRMLADIGLHRSDVTRALMMPKDEDPTRMLSNARCRNLALRFRQS